MPAFPSHHAIQPSRSELKFTVTEDQAQCIRAYLGARMRPDPNAVPGGYPVCSVYLDSPDDLLMSQTDQGLRNRFKLRARIYSNSPSEPAFLEIKRREGNCVKKQRARVDRDSAAAVLAGQRVSIGQSRFGSGCRFSEKEWSAFQEFCRLRDAVSAIGTTYVAYRREAFVSPHHLDWRATFDRQLAAGLFQSGSRLEIPEVLVPAGNGEEVVFELKFTNRFPHWMRDLVRDFDLIPGPFPKYVTCRRKIITSRSIGLQSIDMQSVASQPESTSGHC